MFAAQRVFLSLLVGASVAVCAEAGEPAPTKPGKYALLVGCTRYPNLKLAYQLRGPANDVLLMRDLLVERFDFASKDIVILSEDAEDDNDRPTKDRIRRAFEHLAKVAGKGDQVFIQLSGHGSQQPQKDPDDPESYEPDGLSEMFLPSDVGSWDDGKKEVVNAIVDVELRGWLKAIRAKGASIALIADCCHSGGVARGGDETFREVPPELLVPEAALREAARKAQERFGTSRGASKKSSPFELPRFAPDLAVIYAAQSTEPTVELKLPRGSPDAKPYGLLTYTLVQVIRQSEEPLTYRELVQRIHSRYVGMGRTAPTPLVEGKEQDREFLGQHVWPGRSRILVKKGADEERMVNAGAIHGLTMGSILAVYPPAGEARGAKPLGHARITRLGTLDAHIEPSAYAGVPAPKELPIGGRCEVVFSAYDNQRLRVGFDEAVHRGVSVPAQEWQRLQQKFGKQVKEDPRLASIQVVEKPANADWLVCSIGDGGIILVSAAAFIESKSVPQSKFFGPVNIDEHLGEWLAENLDMIARARSLVALATAASMERSDPDNGADIAIELLRYRENRPGAAFEVVDWSSGGRELSKGDVVGFRMTNRGRYAADVTLLFVDSEYGITVAFPEPGSSGDNRVRPNKSHVTRRMTVNATTTGLEHIVMIAVKIKPDELAMDFSFLGQRNHREARLRATSGEQQRGLASPLGLLFQNALYGKGKKRGLTRDMANDYSMRVLSWTTLAAAADQVSRANAPKQATPAIESEPVSGSAAPDVASPLRKEDAAGGFSWQPILYLGGGLLAGVVLVLLLNRRNVGARRSSDRGSDAP